MIVDPSEVILELGLSGSISETERAIVMQCIAKADAAVKRHLKYDPEYKTHTEYYPQSDDNALLGSGVWDVIGSRVHFKEAQESSSRELQVRNIPVRSITSLHLDYDGRSGARSGSFPASSLRTIGQDYWPNWDLVDSSGNAVCRDGILRSEGTWPDSPGSIKLVYVAGYTSSELRGGDPVLNATPIWESVIDEAIRRVKKTYSRMKSQAAGLSAGPFTSESLGSYSYSVNSGVQTALIGISFDLLPETERKLSSFVNYGVSCM